MTCDRCNAELHVGDWPFCPHGPVESFNVQSDSIPGGLVIEHGLCNEDGSPRRYYSKTEILRESKRRGWSPFVRHVGERGSDKSPHTTRWI